MITVDFGVRATAWVAPQTVIGVLPTDGRLRVRSEYQGNIASVT